MFRNVLTRIIDGCTEISREKKCCPILTSPVSGSPILQDGKLVGAVTHVMINDPQKGYGILIENMLDAADAGEQA